MPIRAFDRVASCRVWSSRAGSALLAGVVALAVAAPETRADDPDLVFRKTTVWKFLAPDDKLGTYAVDDPDIEGISCYFTVPEKGGWTGWLGLAEELSKASLSCQQVGPVKFKRKLAQGDEAFSQRRSLIFKRMQIVRGCDVKRNVIVYVVYTDRLIDGSPESSTASIPIQAWDGQPGPKCKDWIE